MDTEIKSDDKLHQEIDKNWILLAGVRLQDIQSGNVEPILWSDIKTKLNG